MKEKISFSVIANCQVQPISEGLNRQEWVSKVVPIPIHLIDHDLFKKNILDFDELNQKTQFNNIITFNNSDAHGIWSTSSLKNKYNNVFTITNIFFNGLHPDITYLGNMKKRIDSPLGDYHSKIILKSYVNGETIEKCLNKFTGQTYEEKKYFCQYDTSSKELLFRDQGLDIQFASYFLKIIKEAPSLFTVNHPTSFVFDEYVKFIAKFFNQKIYEYPNGMLPNYLSSSAWWPIYPEIAEYHELKYQTPFLFRQPDHLGGKFLNLNKFIEESYAKYSDLKLSLLDFPEIENF